MSTLYLSLLGALFWYLGHPNAVIVKVRCRLCQFSAVCLFMVSGALWVLELGWPAGIVGHLAAWMLGAIIWPLFLTGLSNMSAGRGT